MIRRDDTPLCDVPPISLGSTPGDFGYLRVDPFYYELFLIREPEVKRYLRPFVGNEEILDGHRRWCLWLVDANAAVVRRNRMLHERVMGVYDRRDTRRRDERGLSTSHAWFFRTIRQPASNFLAIPGIWNPAWKYLPVGRYPATTVPGDTVQVVPKGSLFQFAVLSSRMHRAWIEATDEAGSGRFRDRYRSIYNRFPRPVGVDLCQRRSLARIAQRILHLRAEFPNGINTSNFARVKRRPPKLDLLYRPDTMPAPLADAHAALDRVVDRCYRSAPFQSDRERVEHLFALYEKLTAPLLPAAPKKRKRET